MKITEYELFFKINKEMFYGGNINVIPNKMELFYHFPWGSNSKTEIKDNKTKGITNGCLPDHISFHKDGKVHSRARDGKNKKTHVNKAINDFNVFDLKMGNYLPFLIDSINIEEPRFIEKRFEKNIYFEPKGSNCFDVTNFKSFSIVLISYCEKVKIENIFKNEMIKSLNIISSCNINSIFTKKNKDINFKTHSGLDTGLLILIVEKVWGNFEKSTHHINKEEGTEFSRTVCLASESDILKNMINLNCKNDSFYPKEKRISQIFARLGEIFSHKKNGLK